MGFFALWLNSKLIFRAALIFVVLFACVPLLRVYATQPAGQIAIDFSDISFELPGKGWQVNGDVNSTYVKLTLRLSGVRFVILNVRVETFPTLPQGRSEQELASWYFDKLRTFLRNTQHYEGFVEGDREIAGRRFPTMSFRGIPSSPQDSINDNDLAVLYFPEGFEARGKFYSFLWFDSYPKGEPANGLEMLDRIISSVTVK